MHRQILRMIKRVLTPVSLLLFTSIVVGAPFRTTPALALSANLPQINAKYTGVSNDQNSPPSSTIAANKSEELELTNTGYEIITSTAMIKQGSLSSLTATSGTFLSDPQVVWDASTNRFYFSLFENKGTTSPDEGIVWGYSKVANPTMATDFCSYFNSYTYGSSYLPDRQSLGDTSNFLLFGANRWSINPDALVGSDLAWVSKPTAGTTCQAANTFSRGITSLKNSDQTPVYTPTPARQVDANSTGWVTATPSYVSASSLTEFRVTKNPTTGAAVISSPKVVAVPSYSYPPPAPQAGKTISGNQAPALETRIYLTQVIMAYDPRVGHDALWTAHTIAGGAGSEVRWYEINPWSHSLDQYGTVSDPSLY